MTYSVGGKQYVAIVIGRTAALPAFLGDIGKKMVAAAKAAPCSCCSAVINKRVEAAVFSTVPNVARVSWYGSVEKVARALLLSTNHGDAGSSSGADEIKAVASARIRRTCRSRAMTSKAGLYLEIGQLVARKLELTGDLQLVQILLRK